jgi:hypothetical protein
MLLAKYYQIPYSIILVAIAVVVTALILANIKRKK